MTDVRQPTEEILDQAITSLKSIQVTIPAQLRTRWAREASRTSAGRGGVLAWVKGFLVLSVPRPAMATALGLLALAGFSAVLFSQRASLRETSLSGSGPQIQYISMTPDATGRITLEWRDGNQRTYRVMKSHDPRDFSRAAVYQVRGNRWTDPSPDGRGGVTYYKVE